MIGDFVEANPKMDILKKKIGKEIRRQVLPALGEFGKMIIELVAELTFILLGNFQSFRRTVCILEITREREGKC